MHAVQDTAAGSLPSYCTIFCLQISSHCIPRKDSLCCRTPFSHTRNNTIVQSLCIEMFRPHGSKLPKQYREKNGCCEPKNVQFVAAACSALTYCNSMALDSAQLTAEILEQALHLTHKNLLSVSCKRLRRCQHRLHTQPMFNLA